MLQEEVQLSGPDDYLTRAKEYWRHAPGGGGKVDTQALLEYSDSDFLTAWNEQKRLRRLAYWEEAEFLRYFTARVPGRHVFSFGCGLGYCELDFLEAGARVTFADIVPTSVACVERLCSLTGHAERSRFIVMDDSATMRFAGPYDFVFAYGVLMHMPESRQAAVLARMFEALKPGGVIWLMVYTPRFVQSVGASFDHAEFGRASDPSVGELDNPWSDWHDDAKLLRLAGSDACILNREEFNEGRYVWYSLGRRSEHGAVAMQPFINLAAVENSRIDANTNQGTVFAEVPLAEATAWDAGVTYRPDAGLHVTTTSNNFHYAVAFPEIVSAHAADIPNRLVFDADVKAGGFVIGLLDTTENHFFYNCTVWRDGVVRGCRDLAGIEWPDRFQVVISNYQPGAAASSEWLLHRLALYTVQEG
jgi:SAM-dependent methyltransferase